MSDALTMDAGARYAFAPSPDLVEDTLHRIYTVFEGSDGRHWTAATRQSAEDFCDNLNAPLSFDHQGWTMFAQRSFSANPYRKSKSGGEPAELPK